MSILEVYFRQQIYSLLTNESENVHGALPLDALRTCTFTFPASFPFGQSSLRFGAIMLDK